MLLSWIHNNTRSSMLLVIVGHFSITMANMFGLSNPTIQDFIRANLVSVAIRWLAAIVDLVATGSGRLARESRSA